MTTAPERRPLAFASVDEILATLRRRATAYPRRRRWCSRRCSRPTGRCRSRILASAGLERTSVYRNLERLEALGVVSHVHVGHGPGLYALVRGADREYLTCDRCGRVTTLDPAALDGVRAALHAEFGHHARFSHFPIHGTCGSCADAEEHHEHGGHAHPHTH